MPEYASGTKTASTASKSASSASYAQLNSEGHPIHFVRGTSTANNVIQWNKNQKYSKEYIKKVQRKVGTDDDGDIGTNTINAIYDYQVKHNLMLDGKWGNECSTCANLPREYASGKTETVKPQTQNQNQNNNNNNQNQNNNTSSGGSPLPNKNWMSNDYTPDLSVLKSGADYEGVDVKNVGNAAKFVAKHCMSSSPLGQCTRGTALFMQLASYARGEASKTYHSACRASIFGNGSSNGNISSSVSNEYAETNSGITKSNALNGNSAIDSKIRDQLQNDGDYVTFDYYNSSRTSYHIVFKVGSTYYSDFKQGSPCGIGTSHGTNHFWNVRYYKH